MKKILSILLIAFSICSLVSCGSNNQNEKFINKKESKKEESINKEETKKDDEVYEDEIMYLNNWEVKLLDKYETNSIKKSYGDDNITSSGKFLVFKLEVKNISNSAKQICNQNFCFSTDSIYTIDSLSEEATWHLNAIEKNNNNQIININEDINPGINKQILIAINVPNEVILEKGILGMRDDTGKNLYFIFKTKENK